MERILARITGEKPGPTLVFFAGLHGNEPAGVTALQEVSARLRAREESFHGNFIALAGNLSALANNIRYHEEDLNRIWHHDRLERLLSRGTGTSREELELLELLREIHLIFENYDPPYYFFDLHTTSGPTEPFVIMNDTLLNRRFTRNYPLPTILGIEEYLEGALLSYLNDKGYVSIGFESGQHQAPEAIENARHFIWFTLAITGFLKLDPAIQRSLRNDIWNQGKARKTFYEIYLQRLLKEGEYFKMQPNFENFQWIAKGTTFATDSNGLVTTKKARQIFMPLYQKKGHEAYYFIRKIPGFFLLLSKYLRWTRMEGLLTRLPGIDWADKERTTLLANTRIARFMAKSFFHLLGYRARKQDANHLLLRSRERNARTKAYKMAPWY